MSDRENTCWNVVDRRASDDVLYCSGVRGPNAPLNALAPILQSTIQFGQRANEYLWTYPEATGTPP